MIMADSIFYNGEIHTMVNETDVCHAMAVYDGKIIATGSTEQICAIKAKKALIYKEKMFFLVLRIHTSIWQCMLNLY